MILRINFGKKLDIPINLFERNISAFRCNPAWSIMSFDLKINKGDLVINNGSLGVVVDGEKLLQDILKIALTPAGANPTNPWYGSLISRSVIGSGLDASVVLQVGKSQLENALKTLIELQRQQLRSGQIVTADEQIQSILDISLKRDLSNPTYYNINIRALSKGAKVVNASFQLTPIG